ncbi:MAG: DUF4263 domain-containing protein [Blastocatellia bacterium]|nr:DUF4263 domain-containing protein [Blastocatellia bacterium]
MPYNLPHGFRKSWTSGYGFTSILNPVIYFLENLFPKVTKLVISSELSTGIKGDTATFHRSDIEAAYNYLNPLSLQYRSDVKFAVKQIFSGWFPKKVKDARRKYSAGHLSRIINEHEGIADSLSPSDTKAVLDLISTFSDEDVEIRRKQLVSAKETIDVVYIETILQEFESLIGQRTDTDTLEEKWHEFFRENSWIFSQLFAFPMVLFEDKAYVGGKTISDAGGKVADFIYKNDFSENVAIIEIKTHKKLLMDSRSYRGKDVFAISKELSGSINQVLDQRDNLQKEFHSLSSGGSRFKSFNSKCFVLIGSISALSSEQLRSFELFRNSNKDVEIVTFDELLQKIKAMISIFKPQR